MMARYFYAYRWTYGIGKKWDDGSWPGYLMVFDSRAERDAWVADDVFETATGIVRPSRQKRRVISWRTLLSVSTMR